MSRSQLQKYGAVLVALLTVFLEACNPPQTKLPPTTSGGGFELVMVYEPFQGGPDFPVPFSSTMITFVTDITGAVGDPSSQTREGDRNAIVVFPNARVNALWNLKWISGATHPECNGKTANNRIIDANASYDFACYPISRRGPF